MGKKSNAVELSPAVTRVIIENQVMREQITHLKRRLEITKELYEQTKQHRDEWRELAYKAIDTLGDIDAG